MKRKNCTLCSIKRKDYETDLFFIVNCKKHFIPLVILKEHKSFLSNEEEELIFKQIKEIYPKSIIDRKYKDCEDHWHVHLQGVLINGL